jgi:hypothetical protein
MTTPLPVRGDRLLLKVEQRGGAGEVTVALLDENGTELRSWLAPQAKRALLNLPLSWKPSGLRF